MDFCLHRIVLARPEIQRANGGHVNALTQSRSVLLTLLLGVVASAEGCAAVEGIFKAGFWVGIVIAVIVVAVVFGIVRTLSS
jgi:hypothetical protein